MPGSVASRKCTAHEDRRSLLTRGKGRVRRFIPRSSPWSCAVASRVCILVRILHDCAVVHRPDTGRAGLRVEECLLSQDRPRASHSHPTHRVSRQTALWQIPLRDSERRSELSSGSRWSWAGRRKHFFGAARERDDGAEGACCRQTQPIGSRYIRQAWDRCPRQNRYFRATEPIDIIPNYDGLAVRSSKVTEKIVAAAETGSR